jgi:arginine N-succinyltransferase
MVLVRPVKTSDLDQLEALAALTGIGLTTLPQDRNYLADRIAKSERSFAAIPNRPGGESYLFVLEDLATHTVIGSSGIVSKVGGFEPFYSYRIDKSLFHSDEIGVHKEVPILTLHEEHDGPAEIGTLFVHPNFRHGKNGKLLQLVRFLFIAEHPNAFEKSIVSEIRGVSDEQGRSPFWDAIGAHFFDIDFRRADYLSIVNKHFIADLMPDHPIYIPLLPDAAQKVIGVPHEQSKAAVKNLEAEGFKFNGMVDIFDAGPVLECACDQVRTIRQSRRMAIRKIEPMVEGIAQLILTTADECRACVGSVEIHEDGAAISAECADTLGVRLGDVIRFAPMPSKTE